jgi:hypothetical protein
VCRLKVDRVATFEPFPPPNSELEVEYARLLDETNAAVSQKAADWSAAREADAKQFAKRLRTQSEGARALIQENRSATVGTVQEMLSAMADGPDSYIGKVVLGDVFGTGDVADREHFYSEVMKNAYLRSFFYALAYYLISISKGRNELQLHRDVHRNDWIDLTLALYVGRRDCVISNDNLHKAIFNDFGVPVLTGDDLC